MIETICWVLVVIIIIMGIVIYNLYTQTIKYEQYILDQETQYNQEFSNYLSFFLFFFIFSWFEIESVDKRGAFSSDDEVGFAFKVIRESIEQIKFKLEQIEKDGQKEENK